MQEVEKIVNGKDLFKRPEYQDVLKNKKQFESSMLAVNPAKVAEIQSMDQIMGLP